jgi:hypothetical protein
MSEPSQGDPIPVARDLRLALDHFAEACMAADLDGMLMSEAGLAFALSHLHSPLSAPTDPDALALEIDALRRARERARRLGASFDELLRMSVGVVAPAAMYDRAGRETTAGRERALEARG